MHVLSIFPRSGFDQSVTTPVLIGVLVSWFFTETFGWVFAGLVVPGYLASVFLLDPIGGLVDVFEAILTYFVARLLGEHLSRFGTTSRVFGRERFFLVVLVSILVRLATEAWLLPHYVHGAWAYSVGLVVVPLAANACWKTGLGRGLVQNGVPALAVYLLLRFVFAKHTNLSLAGFELATENVAASFLASPKAYILLITGAALAAATNLRYGWDFNGILVPALLALALFAPIKFGATFAEALVLYLVVLALLRVTPLGRANIEGPRRTVLFFSVDYAMRFAFAATMGRTLPGGDIVAFMGFGYLLPTLLAVKMAQKGSAPLVLLPTLKVSALGFAVGTLIGFGATRLDPAREASASAPPATSEPPRDPAAAALWASVLALETAPEPDESVTGDLGKVREMLARAAQHDVSLARRAHLEVTALDGGVSLLHEPFARTSPRNGVPALLYRHTERESLTVVLVPAPLADPILVAAAGAMVIEGGADAVVIAGVEERSSAWVETTAHATARWLAKGGTLLTLRGRRESSLGHGTASAPRGAELLAARFGAVEVLDRRDGESSLVLDARQVAGAIAPPRAAIALDSALAMATALDEVRPAPGPTDPEHVAILRRLVLEPLLSPAGDEADRAFAPFAARAIGYRISAPSPWVGGGEAVALLPEAKGRPLAVFARTAGVRRQRVVEAPVGGRRASRDLALRFGAALEADAIIVGEAWTHRTHGGALRAAHSAATTATSPVVFVVRDDPSVAGDALALGAWVDDRHGADDARSAAQSLGLTIADSNWDLAVRELGTRTLMRATPLVMLSAGAGAEARASLDDMRRASARLREAPIRARDGSLAEAASALLASLDRARPRASDDLAETTRRAASDESVTAVARLADQLRTRAAAAALVRSAAGSHLVVVALASSRLLVISVRVDTSGDLRIEERADAKSCVDAPVANGVCSARTP